MAKLVITPEIQEAIDKAVALNQKNADKVVAEINKAADKAAKDRTKDQTSAIKEMFATPINSAKEGKRKTEVDMLKTLMNSVIELIKG